ncbi:hypothetical protein [Histidinibacterium lentulum]|uniref:Uncharacterized protein n=1 Tax=Histidinibacterium lentulum TaxID=2480588 RepID=A0A3N2R9K7_9RHOB|nr:hypothetical protein [Histidinibacterium lentulum]ROU04160.1 hypothetical protein EAT49_01835 [Histidinibacterium lentulum]
MDWTTIERRWTAHVPRALTRWPQLDEADLLATDGDRAEVNRLLQNTLGLDELGADAEIADWISGLEPADAVMDETRDDERIDDSARSLPDGEEPLHADDAFGDGRIPDRPIGRTD